MSVTDAERTDEDAVRPADLKAFTADDLERFVESRGYPAYRGRQLREWLFRHRARSFEEMHTLPKSLRAALRDGAFIRTITATHRARSTDGTIKTLFRLSSGRSIETVLIPDLDENGQPRRMTVCVSSQVGCAMGCVFCATGRMGFQENLTASEIVDQVLDADDLARAEFGRALTNVVFMGMGEPMLNLDAVLGSVGLMTDPSVLGLSPKRITVSTVGLAQRIRDLADVSSGVKLAVSLHAPDDAKRSSIMPVNRRSKTDLRALRDALLYYAAQTGQPVTYEYCMFEGFNDGESDADNLARVTQWVPSKVNLIMYNEVPGTGFKRTDEPTLNRFIARLVDRGVRVTVRRSRGQDIAAACGQLAVEGQSR